MNQPPQTNKRIVSKGEYIRLQIGHTTVRGTSLLLLAVAAICFLAVVACGIHVFETMAQGNLASEVSLKKLRNYESLTCFFGLAALVLGKIGFVAEKKTASPLSVIALSQEEIDALPAPDSLVRASDEPMQEQQSVLLRAATSDGVRHEEQLVRASTGGTE